MRHLLTAAYFGFVGFVSGMVFGAALFGPIGGLIGGLVGGVTGQLIGGMAELGQSKKDREENERKRTPAVADLRAGKARFRRRI